MSTVVDHESGGVAFTHVAQSDVVVKNISTVLSWEKISYSILNKDDPSGKKVLLQPMSGEARPQQLLAIMGSSGAGKSTLLDVLAGRLESSSLEGSLLTNGKHVNKRQYRKITGYVMQSDALFPLLTVRETFQFAAYLRVSDKTVAEKNEIAEKTMQLLHLEDSAETIIGDDQNRGLSGGQKRRVSIGVDIVHHPAVIFLDEPTSGLDSNTALTIVQSLKQLAVDQNSTVIMTIHQPSARLFSLIDNVIFLSQGYVTYNGLVSGVIPYLDMIYNTNKLGDLPVASPPEIFLELTDDLIKDKKFALLTDGYLEPHIAAGVSDINQHEVLDDSYANSFVGDVYFLFLRALKNFTRVPQLFFARVGASIFFGIQIGTLFLNSDNNTSGLSHKLAYFVFTLAFYYYTSLEALPIFLAEREIFQREYSRGAYRALAYTISSQLVVIPFNLILAIIYSSITWWLVGLPNFADTFFFHIFCVFTTLLAGNSFVTMMSVLVPDPMAGQTLGSALFSVMFLYSGFFIKRKDIPDYWIYCFMGRFPGRTSRQCVSIS